MMLVFLLEEKSVAELLEILLPKILPPEVGFITIPHRGKSDLQKSIPNKLKGWNDPSAKFVIVHDQDSWDCIELKKHIRGLCQGSKDDVLIRIACHEMEAWYFGDLTAVSKAYGKNVNKLATKNKYRNPDAIGNPKDELRKLFQEHQQISGARKIGEFMDIERNISPSFRCFVNGIRQILSS